MTEQRCQVEGCVNPPATVTIDYPNGARRVLHVCPWHLKDVDVPDEPGS